MSDVYFLSEPKRAQKKGLQVWSISDLNTKASGLVTSHILFIRAWSVVIQPLLLLGMEKQTY